MRAQQIVLPTEDLRASLIAQVHALRQALGRSPAVLARSVKKQFGVPHGIEDLDARQLAAVLLSLEQLIEHQVQAERVREACRDYGVTPGGLDTLLEINYDGRDLDQLSVEELTDLRILVEGRGMTVAAGVEAEPVWEVVM